MSTIILLGLNEDMSSSKNKSQYNKIKVIIYDFALRFMNAYKKWFHDFLLVVNTTFIIFLVSCVEIISKFLFGVGVVDVFGVHNIINILKSCNLLINTDNLQLRPDRILNQKLDIKKLREILTLIQEYCIYIYSLQNNDYIYLTSIFAPYNYICKFITFCLYLFMRLLGNKVYYRHDTKFTHLDTEMFNHLTLFNVISSINHEFIIFECVSTGFGDFENEVIQLLKDLHCVSSVMFISWSVEHSSLIHKILCKSEIAKRLDSNISVYVIEMSTPTHFRITSRVNIFYISLSLVPNSLYFEKMYKYLFHHSLLSCPISHVLKRECIDFETYLDEPNRFNIDIPRIDVSSLIVNTRKQNLHNNISSNNFVHCIFYKLCLCKHVFVHNYINQLLLSINFSQRT